MVIIQTPLAIKKLEFSGFCDYYNISNLSMKDSDDGLHKHLLCKYNMFQNLCLCCLNICHQTINTSASSHIFFTTSQRWQDSLTTRWVVLTDSQVKIHIFDLKFPMNSYTLFWLISLEHSDSDWTSYLLMENNIS